MVVFYHRRSDNNPDSIKSMHKIAKCWATLTGATSTSSIVITFRMGTREERSEIARNEKLFYFTIRLKGKDLGMLCLCHQDLVFSTPEGKPLRPNTVSRAWTMLAARAGLKVIRLHDSRHTHASLMLKQGVHPKIVQERLGHASMQITLDTYSHVAPGLQEAAAESFDRLVSSKYNDTCENELVEKHY